MLPDDERSSRRKRHRRGHLSLYLSRMTNAQMDLELAGWQLLYLVIAPKRVYKSIYFHKQTKNHWARDDPAFHIIIGLCMIISAVAYGIAFSVSFAGTLKLILYTIGVEYLACGALVATALWLLTNKTMIQHRLHAVDQSVEWMYCFDVHCNSFFPFFLLTYVLQFFLIGIVYSDTIIGRVVGNTIYLVAFCYYTYITFLGYNALPFLKNVWVFLYPIAIATIFWVFSLFTFSMSKAVFALYFE
ncbi:UNC-50 [Gorgonomyces haynaldii]|nr:UNC-50 [Gorgonomyces haynaldii]